ncbi:MAG: HAD family hydrolase, partial [Anaerolineae bacterium]
DKTFAAGTDRAAMEKAAQEFGVDLWGEHVGNVIYAMRRIASELGLEGNANP